MKIQDKKHVSIEYTLSLESGEVADRSESGEPLQFVCGANQIIAGLEKGLQGMEAGQSARIRVEPREGYGEHREELIREIPRENFPEGMALEAGMGFEARGPHGPVLFRVRSVSGDAVSADFNHPLAGETLYFDVKVAEVRDPTAEELEALSSCSPSDCSSCGCSCG